ncbi:endonuclease/exonuclease/phosphatase family protein [Novosphingobium sp. 9]|uniref:endonuclease/exonuclease/phosphatase family protein n=1 Tax=Novosphingobium sp. 9 TaxID=2025349 RepID=UPI0021B6C58C|nr:endonuclease/exonuclease/phosphatase family protein [Novosphingobium sp. 9]
MLTGIIALMPLHPSPAEVMPAFSIAPASDNPDENSGTLTVMTYNVKGLPSPIAFGRPAALAEIGRRLAGLRSLGKQPHIIALQEAFTPDAKAIAARAGYRYVVFGPDADAAAPLTITGSLGGKVRALTTQASWSKGETEGKWLDSGLVIMSDYPIIHTRKIAYSSNVCAGYDCLAAKGVLVAWVQVPGSRQPIAIADTHLNSRHASGVAEARANLAYALQIGEAQRFLAKAVSPHTNLILAGDFNIGHDDTRIQTARQAFDNASDMQDATASAERQSPASADIMAVLEHAKDKQFYRAGVGRNLRFIDMHVPFGKANGGETLSDHLGFVTSYALNQPSA